MVKLVYTGDLKSPARRSMSVRLRPDAPNLKREYYIMLPVEERKKLLEHALSTEPRFGLYEIYATKEEALEKANIGDKIGVGYPLAHLVYRISETKNKDGIEKILNFSYHELYGN